MNRLTVAAFAVFALASCGQKPAPPPEPAAETVRSVAGGDVIGYIAGSGAHAWLAVPFAAPPVGDLRWRAPRPAAGWQGARSAVSAGPPCPQISNAFHRAERIPPGRVIGDEACLTLDIYAPATAKDGPPLPVMVWVHGGANIWGRSSAYDGSTLAANENVIVVAVQYRMGPLGWFAHPALRESAQTPEDAGANFGTLDIIAALEWVRDNIAAFGGDPRAVTLFGESAGGRNTASLLASPLASGLFHRAIVQSGNFDSYPLALAEGAPGAPDNSARAIAARLGADNAEALRDVSLDALYGAVEQRTAGSYEAPNVIADGVVLPAAPMRDAFFSLDSFNAVPLITGVNRDEMKLFQLFDPKLTRRLFGVFVVARDQDFYDAYSDVGSRLWRILALDEPAAAMTRAGHADVFTYRFDWDEGGRFLFMDTSKILGAAHAMEIPFVFNNFRLFGELDRVLFNRKNREGREALADAMGAYWAEFARTGDPGDGGRGLPRWPRWGEEGALMRFDSPTAGGIEAIAGVDTLDALIADMKNDARLDDERRCRIVGGLGGWFVEEGEKMAAALGCAGD